MSKILQYLGGLFVILITVVSALNLTAGVVGGVWLIAVGLWKPVLFGFIYSIFSHFLWGIVIMIGLVFSIPGMKFYEKGATRISLLFIILSNLFQVFVIYLSVTYIFAIVMQLSEFANAVPVLLYSYAVSFAPWVFLATKDKESGNSNAHILIFCGQTSFILGIVLMLITLSGVWINIGLVTGLVFGVVINLTPIIQEIINRKNMERISRTSASPSEKLY